MVCFLFIGLANSNAQISILNKVKNFQSIEVECTHGVRTFTVLRLAFAKNGDLYSAYSESVREQGGTSLQYFKRLPSDTLVWYKSENRWVRDTLVSYRKMEIISDSVLIDSLFYIRKEKTDTAIKSYAVTKRSFNFSYPLYLMTGKELATLYKKQEGSYDVQIDSVGNLVYISSKLTERRQSGCVVWETNYSKRFYYDKNGLLDYIETNKNGRIIENMKVLYTDGIPYEVKVQHMEIGDYALKIKFKE